MNILNSIKKLIPSETNSVLEIEENFSNFKATLKLSKSIIAESNLIEAIINTVESNDSLFTFNVKYDDSEEISLDPNDIDSFIAELNNYTYLFDINSMTLRIIISKEKYNSSVNIYSIEHFSNYLLTDNPSIILNILSDKVNIARNILSLYLKDDNKLDIDTSVLSAIQSNNSLYLKSNVENYFEIKTKVIDNIINTNNQISDMINDLASNFMKNLSAIGTFIITIIIVNSINDGKFKDILTETEVNELLKNNEYYNTDMNNANTKRKFYCILWCIFLLVFLILLFILGFITLFQTQK